MKTCTVCQQEQDYSNYSKLKTSKDGYGYRCKPCDKNARLSYRANNKERFAEVSRRRMLKYRYGITLEEYYTMLEKQDHCCAICSTTNSGASGSDRQDWSWAVDHCHDSGKVRGLLCSSCNRGLGMLGDNAESLERAIRYLQMSEKQCD